MLSGEKFINALIAIPTLIFVCPIIEFLIGGNNNSLSEMWPRIDVTIPVWQTSLTRYEGHEEFNNPHNSWNFFDKDMWFCQKLMVNIHPVMKACLTN